jgi:hypothetical protein
MWAERESRLHLLITPSERAQLEISFEIKSKIPFTQQIELSSNSKHLFYDQVPRGRE